MGFLKNTAQMVLWFLIKKKKKRWKRVEEMNAEVSRAAIRVRLKKEKDAEGDCAGE